MAILRILEWPAPVLSQLSEPVTQFDQEFKNFVRDMQETMLKARGIGLAANQVGVAKRVITIQVPYDEEDEKEGIKKESWHNQPLVFVNPELHKKIGKTRYQEGCLSFPDVYEYLERSSEIWVRAQDQEGQTFEIHASGLLSICLQHEIDHINGIVFTSRMSKLKSSFVEKKMLRRQRSETPTSV